MPPQLTEAWSVAYLQIMITLIVFAFGIPTFVYQVIAPENIRHIINKYMKPYLKRIAGIVILITIFALCFVWFLHPCTTPIRPLNQLLGAIIITIVLVATPIFWLFVLVKFLREKVVKYLEKEIFESFKREGSKPHEELIDLITLGERSEAGYEKEIVLKAMSRLITRLQEREGYKGGGLEYVLRDFDKIVTGKDKPGNESDFQLSIGILEDIFNRLNSQNLSGVSDEIFVYDSLKKLGQSSVELNFSSQVILRIRTIASTNSDVLFEIGVSAFNSGNCFSALAALDKLETLSFNVSNQNHENAKNEKLDVKYQLFGLMAHFWTKGGSARRRVESFLEAFRDEFTDIDQLLGKAVDAHYNDARYDTADKLMEMRAELAGA
ncbi:hypothetical protein ACFLRB_02265 [Acidobacteriota bacterium]